MKDILIDLLCVGDKISIIYPELLSLNEELEIMEITEECIYLDGHFGIAEIFKAELYTVDDDAKLYYKSEEILL